MPLRNVRLTPEEQEYVISNVESGRFGNVTELVQAALKALKREERARQVHAAKETVGENQVALPHFRQISVGEFLFPDRRRRSAPIHTGPNEPRTGVSEDLFAASRKNADAASDEASAANAVPS